MSKRSKHQTIHLRVRFQREQWRHQLILETTIHRDIIYLWDRIYETNSSRKENHLITKSDDSVDIRRRIFSDDDDIRKQSKRYCFDQKFSVSRTNQAHRYSNSLHQKKSDWRIYWSVLRAHRSNDNWRFNQITDQKQIRSVSRCIKNRINHLVTQVCESYLNNLVTQARESYLSHFVTLISALRDSDLWKLNNESDFNES